MLPIRLPGQKRQGRYGENKRLKVGGETFDSKGELRRWGELQMLERAGHISELRRQVPFVLAAGVRYSDATRATPALVYRADFVYLEDGQQVVEDFKGGIITPEFKIKRHLLKALHGIEIRIVRK